MMTKVTSDDFRDLVNPYTGKRMTVMMNVTGSTVLFFCPDTYSTADTFTTADECYRMWNRVNDIEGGRSGKAIVCAYTGKPLSLVHTGSGCYYTGGFNPHLFHRREEFLYYASMRNGVSKFPKPGPDGRVSAPARQAVVTDTAKAHAEKEAPKLDEDRVHMVEGAMSKFKDILPGSSTVSMSTGRKRHGK